jgi:ribosomal protein S18 acetylase RimI-like enzyme
VISIRRAIAIDVAAIAQVIRISAQTHITPELSAEATAHFLQANNDAAISSFLQQGFVYFVAESRNSQGHEIVGCVGMRHHSHLYHLFVADRWQGQGIARRLWQQAMDDAKQHGHHGSYTVNSSNNAVAVYQAFGFVRTAPMQQSNGVWFNPMQLNQS